MAHLVRRRSGKPWHDIDLKGAQQPWLESGSTPHFACSVQSAHPPVTSDIALARKARLVHGIPLASYEGFVVFKTIKHTPKSLPVGIYEGFGGSKWTKITPGGHPIALCLGLAKTAQTLEHLERSREFKGVKEGGEVFEGRGAGKATIVESSMSRKGVVQNVPESWLV